MGLLMIRTTDRLLILAKTFSVLQKWILQKNHQKLLRPEAEKWRPRQKSLRPEAEKSAKNKSSEKLPKIAKTRSWKMAPVPKIPKTRSWKMAQKKKKKQEAEYSEPRKQNIPSSTQSCCSGSFLEKPWDSLWQKNYFFWEIVWAAFGPNWVWWKESFPTFISFQK